MCIFGYSTSTRLVYHETEAINIVLIIIAGKFHVNNVMIATDSLSIQSEAISQRHL